MSSQKHHFTFAELYWILFGFAITGISAVIIVLSVTDAFLKGHL